MHPHFLKALADDHCKDLHAMAAARSARPRRGLRTSLLARLRLVRSHLVSGRVITPAVHVDDLSWAWDADDEPFGSFADPSRYFDAS